MKKLIFVLLDGLNYETAMTRMCYLQSVREQGQAQIFCVRSQLPPLSRPVYATFLTGLPPAEHGIIRNYDRRKISRFNILSHLAQSGKKVCAAAYAWFYELCEGTPFNPAQNRLWQSELFNSAIFYHTDSYPDAELFADAEALRLTSSPHLLLVHSMGIDWAGHCNGGKSPQYQEAASNADSLLALYAPTWIDDGYELLVASDHGMNADGSHYSSEDCVMNVPLWLVGKNWTRRDKIAQTDIAGEIASFFGLESEIR